MIFDVLYSNFRSVIGKMSGDSLLCTDPVFCLGGGGVGIWSILLEPKLSGASIFSISHSH